MKLLLDTHIFLWLISGDHRLSKDVVALILDPENEVYLSVISIWEVIVKYQIGKIVLPQPPEAYLPLQREKHQISSLDLDEGSVSRLVTIPPIHRDPFDRMLVCQALRHQLSIVTVDPLLRAYPVQTLS